MKFNESSFDRIVRIVVGAVLGILIALKIVTGGAAIVAGIVAAVLLLTGVIGLCPIYMLLRISTRKAVHKD